MNLQQGISEFIKAKEIENLSDKTMQLYRSMTAELLEQVGNIPIEAFDSRCVREFLSYQREREGRFGKLSGATIHKYFSVVRTLSRWLKDQGYQKRSATEKMRAPRVETKLPECLTDEEVIKLLNYLRGFCGQRIQLIFSFFLDTGARLSEVVNLDLNDLHLNDGWVKVYGKGRRERILPLGKTLKHDLTNYVDVTRPMIAEEDEEALFVTHKGTRYTREGMSTLIKTKLKKIGVTGHYGPHKLRHTFATNYLRNKGSIEHLRMQLGHRDLSTTQRYLSLVPEDLYKAQQISSPLDNFQER